MQKRILHMLLGIVGAAALAGAGAYGYVQQPKFGALPSGERLERILASPHFSEGIFHNITPIPQNDSKGGLFVGVVKYLFTRKDNPVPPVAVPSVKTDLMRLDPAADTVIWLGHSSYFMQLGGKRILIDPVFSDNAAPVPLANKAFPGTSLYTADDMPIIDHVLISHDHWDHLDYPTIIALRPKIRNVVCPLGVGAHLERWGLAPDLVREADWYTEISLEDGLSVHVLPARHFSGRFLTGNKTLWAGFALITPARKIFFSGDSGYGPHFADIGERFGGFDLAILDSGQYDVNWRYVHMMPEDAARAALDLRARALLPAHTGKFSIAYHTWDDPFIRIAAASHGSAYRLLTPMIGEPVNLADERQQFTAWWEHLEHGPAVRNAALP